MGRSVGEGSPLPEVSLALTSDRDMDDALAGLKLAALDPDPIHVSRMEVSVLRQMRQDQDVKSLRWWTPFVAALVAGFLVAAFCLSLLQPSPASLTSDSGAVSWPDLRAENSTGSP